MNKSSLHAIVCISNYGKVPNFKLISGPVLLSISELIMTIIARGYLGVNRNEHSQKSLHRTTKDCSCTLSIFLCLISSNRLLSLSYKYSHRNGFGPVPEVPSLSPEEAEQYSPNHQIELDIACKLHKLLCISKAAGEAAIHKNTSLMLIICLAHGNIGSKGLTSCECQTNLPEEYNFIVIKCNGSSQLGGIKSTIFDKNKIGKVLM